MPKPGDSVSTTAPNPAGVDAAVKAGGFADGDLAKVTTLLSSFAQYRLALRAMGVRDADSMAMQVVLHG